eukprot:362539-Chlamydomonas_euryale.AAC.1
MQQSGALPAWNKFLVTGGGIGWRGDAHLRDGSGPDGLGVDLSGGWYASGGEAAQPRGRGRAH